MPRRFLPKFLVLLSALALALVSRAAAQSTGIITTTAGQCPSLDASRTGLVSIQVTGSWTGTLTPEISVQGANSPQITQVVPSTSSTPQTSITANGVYYASGGGAVYVCGPTSTGTANIYFQPVPGPIRSNGGGSSGGGNVSTTPSASQNILQPYSTIFSVNDFSGMRVVSSSWNWLQVPSSPSSISPGSNTITLSPCPLGVDVNSSSEYYTYDVYLAGTGTPEAVPVTGGTCSPGATSGTIIVTAANSHTAGYTVGSASSGIQEAWNDAWTSDLPTGSTSTAAPYVKQAAGINYNVYATVYLRGRGGVLDGKGALTVCYTRGPCIYSGTTQGTPYVSYHKIYNMTGTSAINVDGAQVASVSASSGTYTVTTVAAHPFVAGDWVDCEYYSQTAQQHWMQQVLSAGLTATTFEVQYGSSTFSAGANAFGWCGLENAFIEDNSDHDIYEEIDVTQTGGGIGTGLFNYGIINDNDQQLQIDHPTNRSSSVIRSDANFPMGVFVYSRGDAPNAGITYVHDAEFTNVNCFSDNSGNGATFADSVCQGFPVFGMRYFGALQPVTVSNVYQESTGSVINPLYSPALGSQMGYLVQGGFGSRFVGFFPANGWTPLFASGGSTATQRNYYVVPHSSSQGVGEMFYVGSAQPTSGSVNVTVQWPTIAYQDGYSHSSLGTLTWDVLVTIGVETAAPYGTGSYALATGITLTCTNGICSYTDTQGSTSSYTVSSEQFVPFFWFEPYNLVNNGLTAIVADFVGQEPGVLYTETATPALLSTGCTSGVNQTTWGVLQPVMVSCFNLTSSSGNSFFATLVNQSDRSGNGPATNSKGRLNFGPPTGATPPFDLITFQDSNFQKTLATFGFRPLNDAGDMAIGVDQTGGLSLHANSSITSYIGVVPSGTNYQTRVTSTGLQVAGPNPWIDITSGPYGADPTRTNDSTTAINNAISACSKEVFVPPGTYLIKGTITANTSGCDIEGINGQSILSRWSGVTTTANMVEITAPTKIHGLTIDGNNSLLSGTPCGSGNANHGCGTLVAVHDTTNVWLDGNTLQNCGGQNACVYLYSNGTPSGHFRVTNNIIKPSSTGTSGNGSWADGIFVANTGASGGAMNYVFIQSNDMDCSGGFGFSIAMDCIGLHATNPNQDFGTMDVSTNKMICPSNANHGFCIEVGEFIACGTVTCGIPSARPHNISVTHNEATASASSVGFYSLTSCSYCHFDNNGTNTNGFAGSNSGMELSFSDHSTATGNSFGNCETTASNGLPFGFLMVDSNFMTVTGNAICGLQSVNGAAGINPTSSNLAGSTISGISGSGTSYTLTTSAAYSTSQQFSQGTFLFVEGANPPQFNGVWPVTANPSSTTLTIQIPDSGLSYVSTFSVGTSATASMGTGASIGTATFSGTFTTTGLGAGSTVIASSCSVTGYNGPLWTVVTINSTTITATSPNIAGSALGSATGCTITASPGTIGGSFSNNDISSNTISYGYAGITASEYGILSQASATDSGAIDNMYMNNTMVGNLGTGQGGETGFALTSAGTNALTDNSLIEGNTLRNTSYGMFIGATGVTNAFLKGNNIFGFTTAQIQSAGAQSLQFSDEPIIFADYGPCNATLEGNEAVITDGAASQSWGATITAGGSSTHYKLYCDHTNWTVEAQ